MDQYAQKNNGARLKCNYWEKNFIVWEMLCRREATVD